MASVAIQGVVANIKAFEGDAKQFKSWLRYVDRYAMVTQIPDGMRQGGAL